MQRNMPLTTALVCDLAHTAKIFRLASKKDARKSRLAAEKTWFACERIRPNERHRAIGLL
jgi:hypothetical protein